MIRLTIFSSNFMISTSLVHQIRQNEGDLREEAKNDYSYKKRNAEGKSALEDGHERNILCDTGDNVTAASYRRGDKTELHNDDDDNTEPDGIESEFLHDRKEDRYGKHYHRKRIHKAAKYQINNDDHYKDQIF